MEWGDVSWKVVTEKDHIKQATEHELLIQCFAKKLLQSLEVKNREVMSWHRVVFFTSIYNKGYTNSRTPCPGLMFRDVEKFKRVQKRHAELNKML